MLDRYKHGPDCWMLDRYKHGLYNDVTPCVLDLFSSSLTLMAVYFITQNQKIKNILKVSSPIRSCTSLHLFFVFFLSFYDFCYQNLVYIYMKQHLTNRTAYVSCSLDITMASTLEF